MKEQFIEQNFHGKSRELLDKAQAIVDEYMAAGRRLTLRQLYYQFVIRFDHPNSVKSYRQLANVVSLGRLTGQLDWDGIEDRGRNAKMAAEFDSLSQAVEGTISGFRLKRWEGQKFYVELWVEKDALSGVLEPIAVSNHVVVLANKGYSSQSAMYEASKRFIDAEADGKECVLLYLGDHDPSGEDMVRDIADRLTLFGATVALHKIGLTIEQVRENKLPHNPVRPRPGKKADPRAQDYIRIHGRRSWELDALNPETLENLAQSWIDKYLDRPMMDRIIAKEREDKAALREFLSGKPPEPPKRLKPPRCRRKHVERKKAKRKKTKRNARKSRR